MISATFIVQPLLAFFLTAMLIVWLRRPALHLGMVDEPSRRKRHGGTVPLTGGIAIAAATATTLLTSMPALGSYQVMFVGALLLSVVGILDDLRETSPRTKLVVQVLVAVLMCSWGNHYLISLGDILGMGPLELANWAIPLTVFATVALINALNMLDGADGLAGSLALVMLCFFGFLAWRGGELTALKVIVVTLGAVAGFLPFNLPHRYIGRMRAFLGDTGSLVLGFTIVWFTIELTQKPAGVGVAPVVMLWITGIVLFDLFTVTVRRLLQRRHPAAPDRSHLHHVLMRRGVSASKAVAIIVGANMLLGLIGTSAWLAGVSEPILFAAFMIVGLGYLAVFLFPARFIRGGRRAERRTFGGRDG